MAIATVRVQSGDVISATLMNSILEQLEELTGGTPAEIEQLRARIQQLEAWRAAADQQVNKITSIDARLAAAETAVANITAIAADVTSLKQSRTSIESRLATVEAKLLVAGNVRISGFDPPQQIPVGQVLTILGAGLMTPLTENLIFINDTPIYNFRLDSDNAHLKIVVPTSIPNVTPVAAGTEITIRVSNDEGEAQKTYKVTPALATTGVAPKINIVVEVPLFGGQPSGALLHVNRIARITGENLHDFQNVSAVRFLYKSAMGPVVYAIHPSNVATPNNFTIEVPVPEIREAPFGETFDAIVELTRNGHIPTQAAVTMTRLTA
jgi:hypothetical protein